MAGFWLVLDLLQHLSDLLQHFSTISHIDTKMLASDYSSQSEASILVSIWASIFTHNTICIEHPDLDTSWTDAGFKSGLDRVLIAASFKRYIGKLCIFDLVSFLLVFRVKSGSKNLSPMQEYTSIKFSDDGKYFKSTLFHWVWWHFLCQSNNKGYGNMECRL